MSAYNIEFINTVAPTVNYSVEAAAEFEGKEYDQVFAKFEARFSREFAVSNPEDIGGILVFSRNGNLTAVYDYENFCGWVV